MSDLPQGWTLTTFGELFDFKGGSQPPKSTFRDTAAPGYVRLLQIRDFESDAKAVFIKDHYKWPKCSAEDIMIGRYGASVGKILGGKAGAYNVALVRMIFDHDNLHPGWVKQLLRSDHFQNPLANISRSAQNGFNKSDLESINIPLPPLPEQRRIVAKIDNLTGKSRRARDHLDHIPRLVEKYKQAILAAAFRDDAELARVGDVITDIRYGTAKKCNYSGGAVPVLRIPNVQRGLIDLRDMKSADFDAKELLKLELRVGDILVIRSNGSLDLVGRSAVVDGTAAGMLFAGYLIRLRVDAARCMPKYLHWFLQSSVARDTIMNAAKSTSGVNNVNAQELQALELPLPSIAVQCQRIASVESAFAWIDRLAADATSARKLIDHLDQSVLGKAFKGELVPQDPADEPASALLDRIRAERTAAPKAKRGRKKAA